MKNEKGGCSIMNKLFAVFFVSALVFTLLGIPAYAEQPVTIEFWHAMRGEKQDAITNLVNQFMKENPDIKV